MSTAHARLTLALALGAALAACSDASTPQPARLDGLSLSAGVLHPAFDPAVTEYSGVLPAGTLGVTVTATGGGTLTLAQDGGSSAALSSGSPSAALTVPARGARSIVSIQVAQGGAATTYSIALVQADSGDATLSGLTVSVGALDQTFSSGVTAYNLALPNGTTTLKVTPTAASAAVQSITVAQDAGAAVQVASGSQSQALTVPGYGGTSTVVIKVTAQDGYTSKTYTLTLSQAGSADATLASLKPSVGALAPAFSATTTAYALVVPSGTASVTLTPKATNPAARSIQLSQDGGPLAVVASGAASLALPVPAPGVTSSILLVVTAQDGSSQARYTVSLSQFISSDAALGSLTASAGALAPAFSATTTSYALAVPYGTASVKLTPTAHDAAAKSITVSQDGGAAATVASGSATAALAVPAVGATSSLVFTVLAQDQKTTQKYTVALTQQPSTDSALASLVPGMGQLIPAFSAATLSYSLTVPSDAGLLTLTPSAHNADARSITIAQDGGTPVAVASGSASAGFTIPAAGLSTTLVVTVTAQSGATTAYTIAAGRAAANDATLASLVVNGAALSPAFAAGQASYTATAPYSAATVTLTAIPHSPQAQGMTLAVDGGSAAALASNTASPAITVPAYGSSSVAILTVTAQDGSTTKQYAITVQRHAPDTDAALAALTPAAGTLTPAFDPATLSYALAAPWSSTSVTITPVAHASTYQSITVSQDGGAAQAVSSGSPSQALTVPALGASSAIAVVCTAQDGATTKTYALTLTQQGRTDATLASLADSAGSAIGFTPGTLAYSFSVPFQTGPYTLTAATTDALATFTINGAAATSTQPFAVPLAIGPNTVTLVVTSADKSTQKSYVLTITEGGSPPGLVHQRTVPVTPATPLQLAAGSYQPSFNASNVPVDTLLRIGFDAPPTIGASGSIKIYKADNTLVDTINIADPYAIYDGGTKKLATNATSTKVNVIGGLTSGIDQVRVVNYVPVFVNGSTVTLVPHNNKLAYNTSYYVTIDSGVLVGKISGSSFGGLTAGIWSFTTKAAAPATLNVAADNSADYATVQGAIDALPISNATSTTISIAPGVYQEMLWIRSKKNITLQGSNDGLATIIQADNCDGFNPGTGGGQAVTTPGAGGTIPTTGVGGGGRSVLLMASTSGIVLDSITLQNTHPQGGLVVPTVPVAQTVVAGSTAPGPTFTNYSSSVTQAETLYFNTTYSSSNGVGTAGTLVAKHSNFISYQDTIQVKGFSWFYDCFITGDTDFIWGNANTALFEHSELRSRYNANSAAVVQSRAYLGAGTTSTGPASYTTAYPGFVFLNSAFTKEPGASAYTAYIARSPGAVSVSGSSPNYLYAGYDMVSVINCSMDTHIDPAGWDVIGGNPVNPNVAPSAVTGWREYATVKPDGTPLDVSKRFGIPPATTVWTIQLTDQNVASFYKDRATIFGGATDGTYTLTGFASFSPVP
jgi:Cadherin-like beta sandwich domain/Pectinesterase